MSKYLIPFLMILSGCSKPKTRIGMVHEYIFHEAERKCAYHQGVHYIVSIETEYAETTGKMSFNDYPCTSKYKFRCEDGFIIDFDSGGAYCFIEHEQLQETLEGKRINT